MNAMAGGHPHLSGSPATGPRGPLSGISWVVGALVTLTAAAVGAVIAVFFAATVVVLTVMGAALVWIAGIALRARRSVRSKHSDVIEARNIGGHSWVAYGWDRRKS